MKGIEKASFQAVVRLILEIECHGLQGMCAEYLATAHSAHHQFQNEHCHRVTKLITISKLLRNPMQSTY